MKIKTVVVGMLSTNCYILYDENTNRGIVIDPGADAPRIINEIEKEDISIEYVIFTHAHFDHILAYHGLKEKYENIKLIIGEKEKEALGDEKINLAAFSRMPYKVIKEDITVKDGEYIELDNVKLKVIETPGHTKGGISLFDGENLFSGDVLFYNSIGRTDFPTGNYNEEIETIENILFKLPDETIVYPGHGETTTIGYEKENNEALKWR